MPVWISWCRVANSTVLATLTVRGWRQKCGLLHAKRKGSRSWLMESFMTRDHTFNMWQTKPCETWQFDLCLPQSYAMLFTPLVHRGFILSIDERYLPALHRRETNMHCSSFSLCPPYEYRRFWYVSCLCTQHHLYGCSPRSTTVTNNYSVT